MNLNFKKTESTRFILPMIHPELNAEFFITDNFINCFAYDANKPHLNNVIFLVYKYNNSYAFIQHEKKLVKFDTYLTDYDYEDSGQTIYAFKTEPQLQTDREKILSGLYSQLNSEYKYRLLRFWNVGINSNFFGLLYNTPIIKQYWSNKGIEPNTVCVEGEYWNKPIIEEESIKLLKE